MEVALAVDRVAVAATTREVAVVDTGVTRGVAVVVAMATSSRVVATGSKVNSSRAGVNRPDSNSGVSKVNNSGDNNNNGHNNNMVR